MIYSIIKKNQLHDDWMSSFGDNTRYKKITFHTYIQYTSMLSHQWQYPLYKRLKNEIIHNANVDY